MSMAQCQHLYEFEKKVGFTKGKNTSGSSRALEARVALLEQKQTTVVMRAYSQTKSPKLITEIIQPLTEREAEPDRATQTLDGQGHQKGTVSPVC